MCGAASGCWTGRRRLSRSVEAFAHSGTLHPFVESDGLVDRAEETAEGGADALELEVRVQLEDREE